MIAPGQRVGHYLIETRLGAGGMGEVFRAFDESLERPVAIKVLPRAIEGHPEARARMLREARAASALVHPAIVTVHEVDEHDGQTILVMELVSGETFSHLLHRRGKLPPAEAISLVRQVGAALDFAHKAGFVHRDIKCSNLMLTPDGRVKVLDFGLSKRMRDGDAPPVPAPAPAPNTVAIRKPATGPAATGPTEPAAPPVDVPTAAAKPGADVRTVQGKPPDVGQPPSMPTHDSEARDRAAAAAVRDDLTVEGAAMGTPGYSALELMDGLAADARADVFSLGVVLYELVTAQRPYTGTDWKSVRDQIAAEKYPRARERVPELSGELDEVINRALRADRSQRTPSIAAMLDELSDASATRKRRRKLGVVFGILAVSGGTIFVAVRNRDDADARTAPADAIVAVVDPADGGMPDAAAPAPPPPAAVQITRTGGCVYAPVFLDDETLAFDLTTPNGARDIATLALGLPRPTVRHIPRAGSLEARPARGADGELLYVVHDQANEARSFVAARAPAGNHEREVVAGRNTAVAFQAGAYYYIPHGGTSLRRVRDKVDEAVLDVGSAGEPVALVAARDGQHLLISGRIGDAGTLCVVDVTAPSVECPPTQDALGARPDTGKDGALYYASRAGIRRRTTAGDDVMIALGAAATGGLAVSPSGDALVWSDCAPRHVLRDASVKPAAELTVADNIAEPVAGPGGRIAWVQHGGELVVRSPDASTVALTAADGGPVSTPAFDAEGTKLAFARGGADPGIWLLDLADPSSARRLTNDLSDTRPLFLPDGSLVFTRDVEGVPHVHRVREGDVAVPAMTEGGRRTVDVDRGTGKVLLRSADGRYFTWWDPATGLETPGPATFAPNSNETQGLVLSPDGGWMLYRSGPGGAELWRTPRSLPQPVAVPLPPETAVAAATITDDGHVLVVTSARRGELWRLDAPADAPW